MSSTGKHALVFGASGISGWSLLSQCLSYPTPSTFRCVTGLCNRPLNKDNALLPDDSRLDIVHGIDLTGSVDVVIEQLKTKVKEVETVDVVFFCGKLVPVIKRLRQWWDISLTDPKAYIQTDGFESLKKVNTDLLRTAVLSISTIAPNLESIILQTGGKGYGLEFPDQVKIQPPLHEQMPRIPEPWRNNIFYYAQYDLLMELSKDANWTFSEVRPDGIVGFAPGTNAMNMAHGIAFYLTLFREVYGAGTSVPFPGKPHGYKSTHSDTFQDILSKMEIYAALNRDSCPNGSAFNIADGETVTWEQVWPGICSYFGLVGAPPQGRQDTMEEFVRKHSQAWDGLVAKHHLQKGLVERQNWGHTQFMLVDFDFDREFSLNQARSAGFTESIDTVKGYKIVFDRMVEAKLIPSFHS